MFICIMARINREYINHLPYLKQMKMALTPQPSLTLDAKVL